MSDRTWRRSSYSGQAGNCVEVSTSEPGIVAVRDSADPAGPEITVSSQAWLAFVQRIKRGEFDR
ncbi:MAG TPA: DUF397 domain-containing protein [Streptosporangiaceae bacterium]